MVVSLTIRKPFTNNYDLMQIKIKMTCLSVRQHTESVDVQCFIIETGTERMWNIEL